MLWPFRTRMCFDFVMSVTIHLNEPIGEALEKLPEKLQEKLPEKLQEKLAEKLPEKIAE